MSESGWWQLDFTIELNDIDREHIGNLIKEGYTSGEIVHEGDE